jgi:hypothetical protein
MDWSVLATFAGVAVAAAGAAWAVVREQSVLRQLERVTAVLKDLPESSPAAPQLMFLQNSLARRLSRGYRAPKLYWEQYFGWFALLLSIGMFASLVATAVRAALYSWTVMRMGAVADVILVGILLLFIAVAFLVGVRYLRRRTRTRNDWLEADGSDLHQATAEGPQL